MVPNAQFVSWCESRGIASPLQLQEGIDSNYRYLSPPTELYAGSILSVPLDACLVANTKEVLSEKLFHEKSLGSKSDYAPYLQMLPPLSSFQDFPRFWTDDVSVGPTDYFDNVISIMFSYYSAVLTKLLLSLQNLNPK